MTFINILIGLTVGVAVMWFLIMPAVNKSTSQKTNKQVTAFSDKIAEEEAQISALKTELESYRFPADSFHRCNRNRSIHCLIDPRIRKPPDDIIIISIYP